MKKGTLNIDFIVAFVLFIVVYFSIFQSMLFFSTGSREAPDELLMESRYFSDVLVESAGYPKNWTEINPTLPKYFGLAYYNRTTHPNILDKKKVEEMVSYNCQTLQLNKTDLVINFMITVSTKETSYSCVVAVGTPPSDARVIERVVYLFDGQNYTSSKLILQTW